MPWHHCGHAEQPSNKNLEPVHHPPTATPLEEEGRLLRDAADARKCGTWGGGGGVGARGRGEGGGVQGSRVSRRGCVLRSGFIEAKGGA